MSPRPAIYLLTVLGLGLCMPSVQAEIDLQGLVKNSPFGEGKAPGEKSGSLEFRGVYVDQGVTYFNIYSPSAKSSTWIAQGETSNSPFNIVVKSYDETGNTLVVENNGQVVKMQLREPVILKLENPAPAPAQAEARNTPALTTANANTPTAKDAKSNVTSEQAQAFREQMRQRWSDRQNSDKGSTPNTTNEKKKTESNSTTDNPNNETKKSIIQ